MEKQPPNPSLPLSVLDLLQHALGVFGTVQAEKNSRIIAC
jgi:hypothetical protein